MIKLKEKIMKIAIFTSSTPIGAWSPARAKRAVEYLQSQGHEVILGNLFAAQDYYRSGTIAQRAQEINQLVQDQPIDLLLAAIGGANTSSILPFLDYQAINQNVKAVCGFSDTTALLSAIGQKCDQVKVIYGPALLPNFGEFESESLAISSEALLKALNNQPNEIQSSGFIYGDQHANWEQFDSQRFKLPLTWKTKNVDATTPIIFGILKGGNLSTLTGIWGSEFAPAFETGDLLFIEDGQKDIATQERLFNFLKLNHVFDKVSGIILGTHNQFDHQGSLREPIEVLLEVLGDQKIPILYDVNISHDKPMLALELNVPTKIDFQAKKILQKG